MADTSQSGRGMNGHVGCVRLSSGIRSPGRSPTESPEATHHVSALHAGARNRFPMTCGSVPTVEPRWSAISNSRSMARARSASVPEKRRWIIDAKTCPCAATNAEASMVQRTGGIVSRSHHSVPSLDARSSGVNSRTSENRSRSRERGMTPASAITAAALIMP